MTEDADSLKRDESPDDESDSTISGMLDIFENTVNQWVAGLNTETEAKREGLLEVVHRLKSIFEKEGDLFVLDGEVKRVVYQVILACVSIRKRTEAELRSEQAKGVSKAGAADLRAYTYAVDYKKVLDLVTQIQRLSVPLESSDGRTPSGEDDIGGQVRGVLSAEDA
ncbi:MAG: hypothetical protein QF755_04365 [Candidatus Peribacteraceae bacterium]|jgi:hypothetical protein|nr:hypothetical protein [Candidatus Peribacteraceae bacterium]HCI03316.1 hypothetical protein [Candidatus Peribacteria bacterium]|tara:strand:- start:338 stop:838 length:501 start_codon:yes stop_codon:yes gene_type:complete